MAETIKLLGLPSTDMRHLTTAVAVAVLTAAAACSSGSSSPQGATSKASTAPSATQDAGPPACTKVLVDGAPVTKAEIAAGCTEPVDGNTVVIPTFTCIGGTQLASPDYSGGHFWGVTGGTWHKVSSTASDAGYKAAYAKCQQ